MAAAAQMSAYAARPPPNKAPPPATAVDYVKCVDLIPGMKAVNVVGIILERGQASKTQAGNLVVQFHVADNTGSVYISLWDEKTDSLQAGDIIQLRGGYTSVYKKSMIVYAGKHGQVERLGEFCYVFAENPNVSQYEWLEDPQTKTWTRTPTKPNLR